MRKSADLKSPPSPPPAAPDGEDMSIKQCLTPRRFRRQPARRAPGVVLLEVLLAMTLFVLAASVIASALRSTTTAAMRIRSKTQANNLAQTILAELATGQVELADTPPTDFSEETEEGDIVNPAEGWAYEITTEELIDLPALTRVTIIVRHEDASQATGRITQWMLTPADEEEMAAGAGGAP